MRRRVQAWEIAVTIGAIIFAVIAAVILSRGCS